MSLLARVEAALMPGGVLASRWHGYEDRRAQLDMARDVARTIERGGVLMAEAPTGVGKSLAYLLPAVLHAAETDERVIVATCTRSLQDQLFERRFFSADADDGQRGRAARASTLPTVFDH